RKVAMKKILCVSLLFTLWHSAFAETMFFRVRSEQDPVELGIAGNGLISWGSITDSEVEVIEYTDDLTDPTSWQFRAHALTKPGSMSVKVADFTIPSGYAFVPHGVYTRGSPLDEPSRDAIEEQSQIQITRPIYVKKTE